jgi:signal transduction histidine kinase
VVALVSIVTAFISAHLIARASLQKYFTQCKVMLAPNACPPTLQGTMSSVSKGFLIGGGIAIVLGLLVSFVIAGELSRPVTRLTDRVRDMLPGGHPGRGQRAGGSEIEELSEAFDSLVESLNEKETLRQNMVTDIAHELRNPLATIKAHLEGIQDGVVTMDDAAVKSILEDVDLLSGLIEDLRELAFIESGQIKLARAPLDPGELLQEVAARYSTNLESAGVSVSIQVEPDTPQAMADPMRMIQVLSNLLRNAICHSPEGGAVTLAARREGQAVRIEVTDTGTGIPTADLPHIFDRFYRAELPGGAEAGGTGIGLAVARSLVEAQGGTIHAESELGKGTTLSFTVPAVSGDA